MKREFHLTVTHEYEKSRLDRFVKKNIEQFSRNQIQKWIEKGSILVQGKNSSPSAKVRAGDRVEVLIPEEEISVLPEEIPLEILYEDKSILAIHKPAGMVSHPASGNFSGTLANAVAHHLSQISKRETLLEGMRLGLVHRLDKETSGVILIAKTRPAMESLLKQFEQRSVLKVYRAIVRGRMIPDRGEIEGSIGKQFGSGRMGVVPTGRFARTEFKVLKRFPSNTYLEIFPKTGRTHQIRVHLSRIGHSILGDKIYTQKTVPSPSSLRRPGDQESEENGLCKRQMLHAYQITVTHPVTKKKMTFTAPLPEDFLQTLKKLVQS